MLKVYTITGKTMTTEVVQPKLDWEFILTHVYGSKALCMPRNSNGLTFPVTDSTKLHIR